MIGIKNSDRDALRLLWFDDPNQSHPKVTIYCFKRLVFGLRISPAILGFTISHHLGRYSQLDPKLVSLLKDLFYIDDLATGEKSVDESFHIYKRSKQIMAEGGFNLRKWNSNSQALINQIETHELAERGDKRSKPDKAATGQQGTSFRTSEEDESYAKLTTGHNAVDSSDGGVKVLGSNWNTRADVLFFNFDKWKEDASSIPATKRSILGLTAKIFDPLGFLTPLTISMKIIFQILCTNRVDWDETLTGDLLSKFQTVIQEISYLHSVRVPRCYFDVTSKPTLVELHGFSDASSQAYAAVVYIRSVYEDGGVRVILVASKSRVAPLKRQTIPRLELLGAVLLSRLCQTITRTVGELSTTYWVDSMTTLCWIRNVKHWKQYVQHRVNEIRKLSSTSNWRYCPGLQNPADLPSRGLGAKDLAENDVWWNGPDFLRKPPSEWPADNPSVEDNENANQESVKSPPRVTHIMVNKEGQPVEAKVDEMMQVERFSSLQRLLQVTARVLRFIKKLKAKVSGTVQEVTANDEVDDIQAAEALWVRAIQRCSFPEEVKLLSKLGNDVHTNSKSKVEQFGLYFDGEGVMRSRGRINASSLPPSSKNPIFLPSKHPFVELLIRHTHNQIKHSGVRDTLTTLRERFWILRGRETVKKIIRHCTVCRKCEGGPFKSQPTPDLPAIRVSDHPPFTHVGFDFAGRYIFTPCLRNHPQHKRKSSRQSLRIALRVRIYKGCPP